MPKDALTDSQSDDVGVSQETLAAADFFTYLIRDCGYSHPRLLGEGRYACLVPFLYTSAIITGRIGDRVGYDDRWCYSSHEEALSALDAWSGSGEPEGWHRHPNTGRRRRMTEAGLEEWINP